VLPSQHGAFLGGPAGNRHGCRFFRAKTTIGTIRPVFSRTELTTAFHFNGFFPIPCQPGRTPEGGNCLAKETQSTHRPGERQWKPGHNAGTWASRSTWP